MSPNKDKNNSLDQDKTFQERIVLIIVHLLQTARIYNQDAVEKITTMLLQSPQSIEDHKTLMQIEEVCKFQEPQKESQANGLDDILLEIQTLLSENIEEIEKIHQFEEKILDQKEGLNDDIVQDLEDVCKNIMMFNAALQKKEKTLLGLNDKLQQFANMLENIENKSQKDPLTELYNRCYLDEMLQSYEDNFIAHELNYAVLFFDIDGFKNINDQFGHLAGDRVLELFAAILQKNSRTSDVVGRYGGDEFLILMRNTNLDIAKDIALRICRAIKHETFVFEGQKIDVTTSIGVADRMSHHHKQEVLQAADGLLYQAKEGGRNQVRWH